MIHGKTCDLKWIGQKNRNKIEKIKQTFLLSWLTDYRRFFFPFLNLFFRSHSVEQKSSLKKKYHTIINEQWESKFHKQ